MKLSCGIVGLPNVGKSTLFNALLSRQVADAANYPFCTIEPNVGIVEVPDERLSVLARIVGTEKIVPAVVEFVDIAGLVKGAHKGEGLGNRFLSHIREVDFLLYVLRAFEDSHVVRAGSVNPGEDFETLLTELILADLMTLEKQKEGKGTKDARELARNSAVEKLKTALNEGRPARTVSLTREEAEEAKGFHLLSAKPAMAVLNISERDLARASDMVEKMQRQFPTLAEYVCEIVPVSVKIEFELQLLSFEERRDYLASLGIEKSGLDTLIPKVYRNLGLINFLTAGKKEVRAWIVEKGTNAQKAAGIIHSDFEKKFARAAVLPFEEFVNCGGWSGAREAGKVRFEGKEYIVKDGDVIEFMINR